MSRSRAQQHRSPLNRRLSHHLGVEAMEGRLMLAAAALDLAAFELQPAQISVGVVQLGAPASEALSKSLTAGEGGTVNYFRPASDYAFDGVWNQSQDAVPSGITIRNQLGALLNGQSLPGLDADSTNFNGTVFNEYDPTSSGLQPVNFQGSLENTSVGGAFDNYSRGENLSLASTNEGGPISLPAILANEELELGPQLDPVQGIKSLAEQLAPEVNSRSPLTATTAADRAITAEWARAMVFETAGGERNSGASESAGDSQRLMPTSESELLPHVGGPLSSTQPSRAAGSKFTRTSFAPAGDAALPNSGAGGQFVAEPEALHVALRDVAMGHAGSTAGEFALTRGTAHAATSLAADYADGVGGQGERATDLRGNAVEAAFEGMGSSVSPEIPLLATDWLSRSLNAAPILLMLALERIAASNSRRNRRDSGPVDIRRPKLV